MAASPPQAPRVRSPYSKRTPAKPQNSLAEHPQDCFLFRVILFFVGQKFFCQNIQSCNQQDKKCDRRKQCFVFHHSCENSSGRGRPFVHRMQCRQHQHESRSNHTRQYQKSPDHCSFHNDTSTQKLFSYPSTPFFKRQGCQSILKIEQILEFLVQCDA